MAALLQRVNPAVARQIQAAIAMDTQDMTFDAAGLRLRFPAVPLTPWAEVIRRDYLPAKAVDFRRK